ncbi:MAG: DUF3857 domain-containing protein [Chitinophagaceae bacterium]|nr:DUF3857 domain-containing protein [Chitinophagaceae bacterium]
MKFFICSFALLLSIAAFSQEKIKIKFGDISPKDFETKLYDIDSAADAVVIADIGSSNVEGNTKGWFSLVYKRFKRIHILNKNGYDAANISIFTYSEWDDETRIEKIKAVTYNLENGKVSESKLDTKSGIFKDKIDKNRSITKFTLPNIKEGSVVEIEYIIRSDYPEDMRSWEFQSQYPHLWSEYNAAIPDFLGYVFLTQGYRKYDIADRTSSKESYRIIDSRGTGASDVYELNSGVSNYRWVSKNVPALKEESYTSTIDNHISKSSSSLPNTAIL